MLRACCTLHSQPGLPVAKPSGPQHASRSTPSQFHLHTSRQGRPAHPGMLGGGMPGAAGQAKRQGVPRGAPPPHAPNPVVRALHLAQQAPREPTGRPARAPHLSAALSLNLPVGSSMRTAHPKWHQLVP